MKAFLFIYGVLVVGGSLGLYGYLAVDAEATARTEHIISYWKQGQRVSRTVSAEVPRTCGAGCTVAVDEIVDDAGLLSNNPNVVKFSLVAGRDGLQASIDGKTAYATPDDLVVWGAAAGHSRFGAANIMLGINNTDRAIANLAKELGVDSATLIARGELRRVLLRRGPGDQRGAYGEPLPVDKVTKERVSRGVRLAANYLARHVLPNGDMDYSVDLASGRVIRGRSWPRQAIAAWFLVEVAAYTGDEFLKAAALRSARFLSQQATSDCGEYRCVGKRGRISLGSTATTVLVYAAIIRAGWDGRYRKDMDALLTFLHSQQRPDGELKHFYNRVEKRPIDRQTQYVNGQAALAFATAYGITKNPKDLEAAKRTVRYSTRVGWDFFGSRYFFGNEHWTCQAVAALMPYDPDPADLDFCLRFNAFSRNIQTPEGGYNLNPVHVPRVTETGSRTEAAVATLRAATAAGVDAEELAVLHAQVKKCLAYLLGYQFDPGPQHLMKKPQVMQGGMPGSKVDLQSRIDFVQHAGAGMLRYLRYLDSQSAAPAIP